MTTYFEHAAGKPELEAVEYKASPDAEAAALRIALMRQQRDIYALQTALARQTEQRNQWRQAYYKALRERAEWTTKETP